jgi:uncharacterized protein (DUF433 family)
MNWRDHIHSTPDILGGKPVVRGTRISVEFLLKQLSAGWDEAKIIYEYPHLTVDDIRAAVGFAADFLKSESYITIDRADAA